MNLQEFKESLIPDSLIHANVIEAKGKEAIAVAVGPETAAAGGHATQYATSIVKRLNAKYQFLEDGCWYVLGCTLDGREGDIPIIKPYSPRQATKKNGKLKPIKYETPQGRQGIPILSWVPDDVAELTWKRFQVTPDPSKTYWENVQDLGIAVAVTEGWKKAASLIGQGVPTIALRGITMWHHKGTNILHDALLAFATPKRRIDIVFDQDVKPQTIKHVRAQALKLGSELDKLGCDVRFPQWNSSVGKGIDDALYACSATAEPWLNNVLREALTLRQYRRLNTNAKAFDALERWESLNAKNYPIERQTQGNYLPELPALEPEAIHVVDAGLGAGKTTRIHQDWLTQAQAQGWFTLVLSPMNSLGQQTAERWQLPHIHESYDRDFWERAIGDGGVVMCPDSLHKVPSVILNRPVLLVMDEANQICQSLANAGTLGDRQSEIVQIFEQFLRHAASSGAIVLAEDGIPDRTVKFIQQLSQAQRVRIFQHYRQQAPWDCTVYSGQVSGYRQRLLEATQTQKVLYVTSSQREAKRIERVLSDLNLNLSVARIDSETNEGGRFTVFFNDPDAWIAEHQPDLLILSPSAKSGISIEAPYFDVVYGYFPALAGDTHWQMLGRYRQPVPRHVYAPPFIGASADEALMSPRRAKQRYQTYARLLASAFQLEDLLDAPTEDAERLIRINMALLDYYADQRAVQGAMKAVAHDYLLKRLERAGHRVATVKCNFDSATADRWKQAQDDIWLDDADQYAGLEIDSSVHTDSWAYKTLGSIDSTHLERRRANKVLWRSEFPGMLFDDPSECYEAFCLDYGALRKGVLLQVAAENLKAIHELERERVHAILSKDIKALYRLPKIRVRAALIAHLGILPLLDGQEYSNRAAVALAIKEKALERAAQIREFLGLNVTSEQTPSAIINKLLRRLGYNIDREDRPGGVKRLRREGHRNQQQWIYRVDCSYSATHRRLLEARHRKLSEVGSHDFSNVDLLNREIMTTDPQTLMKWKDGVFCLVGREGGYGLLASSDEPMTPKEHCLRVPLSELEPIAS